jgi:hypothetical protein
VLDRHWGLAIKVTTTRESCMRARGCRCGVLWCGVVYAPAVVTTTVAAAGGIRIVPTTTAAAAAATRLLGFPTAVHTVFHGPLHTRTPHKHHAHRTGYTADTPGKAHSYVPVSYQRSKAKEIHLHGGGYFFDVSHTTSAIDPVGYISRPHLSTCHVRCG